MQCPCAIKVFSSLWIIQWVLLALGVSRLFSCCCFCPAAVSPRCPDSTFHVVSPESVSDGQAAASLWPRNVLPIDFFKHKAFNRLQILFSSSLLLIYTLFFSHFPNDTAVQTGTVYWYCCISRRRKSAFLWLLCKRTTMVFFLFQVQINQLKNSIPD